MKIYTGWILNIEGTEYEITGSMTIRKNTSYTLKRDDKKVSIRREALIEGLHDGSIKYIGHVAQS